MKIYRGKKAKIGKKRTWFEIRVEGDGRISRILKIPVIAWATVEWTGAGDPTNISLAILLDYFEEFPTNNELMLGGKSKAQRYFIEFRSAFIMPLVKLDEWEISETDIRAWIEAREASALFGSDVQVTKEEE